MNSFSSEGRCPSDSPTRALARRFAGALRSRGSLATLVRWNTAHGERAHLIEVRAAGAFVVGRDHLGHHLLADLDALLDEREIDAGCGAFLRELLDPLLRLVPHVTGRDPEDPLGGVARPL